MTRLAFIFALVVLVSPAWATCDYEQERYIHLIPPAAQASSAVKMWDWSRWWWLTPAASSSTKPFRLKQGTTVLSATLQTVSVSKGVGFRVVKGCYEGGCDWYWYNYVGPPMYVQPKTGAVPWGSSRTKEFQAMADEGFDGTLGIIGIGGATVYEAYIHLRICN